MLKSVCINEHIYPRILELQDELNAVNEKIRELEYSDRRYRIRRELEKTEAKLEEKREELEKLEKLVKIKQQEVEGGLMSKFKKLF